MRRPSAMRIYPSPGSTTAAIGMPIKPTYGITTATYALLRATMPGPKPSYRKALEYVPSAGTAIGIRAYVSFGNFYLKQKKYRGAVEMYRRAEELLGSGNVECRAPVYSGLARAYDASGDGRKRWSITGSTSEPVRRRSAPPRNMLSTSC